MRLHGYRLQTLYSQSCSRSPIYANLETGYIHFVARKNVESRCIEPVRSHVAAYRQCKCRIPAHCQCLNFYKHIIKIPTRSPCFYSVPRTLTLKSQTLISVESSYLTKSRSSIFGLFVRRVSRSVGFSRQRPIAHAHILCR